MIPPSTQQRTVDRKIIPPSLKNVLLIDK
jgi:hypothetical protein